MAGTKAKAPGGLAALKGAGPKTVEKLARLGVHDVGDLLLLLPMRFEDRTRITPIAELRHGDARVVEGEVLASQVVMRRRRSLVCTLGDSSGRLTLWFFHFGDSFQRTLSVGARVRCFGEARGAPGALEMVHPEFADASAAPPLETTLTPVYPSTEGLAQKTVRALVAQALASEAAAVELLPEAFRERHGLGPLAEALDALHAPRPGPGAPSPSNTADLPLASATDPAADHAAGDPTPALDGRARDRLAFEELLAHQLSLRQRHHDTARNTAPALRATGALSERFLANLAFELTAAQARVLDEIRSDLARPSPMQRLLQGDVGSGKTVVAAHAALTAIEAGYQAVLMAPTELLAEQHRRTFTAWFEPLGITVAWLSGSLSSTGRRLALAQLAGGEAGIAVGTHALFQESVSFARLGLALIDEQHKFGVHQRLALTAKSAEGPDGEALVAHQLVMTATPIPRTLAMTSYADLDVSVLDELPPGRHPVDTAAVSTQRRDEVVERISHACAHGQQAYWICTLIEESAALQASAAQDTYDALGEALETVRVGLVHGRMKQAEKEWVMRAFEAHEIDLLVATTVVEVGVNVPNASLMVIENAERLGLAQLHQLRGRVGRGAAKSACVLLYEAPLSQAGRARLDIMRETNDGFLVAEKDLEIRGPGELLGTRQTGLWQLRVADLERDAALLEAVSKAADDLLQGHPEAVAPLRQRWVGDAEIYAKV